MRMMKVFHISSNNCPKTAQTDYKKRHDNVAQLVVKNLCKRMDWSMQRTGLNTKQKILLKITMQRFHGISLFGPIM